MNEWTLALDLFLITCAQEASDQEWLLSTCQRSELQMEISSSLLSAPAGMQGPGQSRETRWLSLTGKEDGIKY